MLQYKNETETTRNVKIEVYKNQSVKSNLKMCTYNHDNIIEFIPEDKNIVTVPKII